MFILHRFGEDRIKDILRRFGPRKDYPMADERPFSQWRKEGKAKHSSSKDAPDNEGKKK